MSPENPNRISVIDPITPAIERVKEMLFRPFDLRRWFVIGFCAWLAYLGSRFMFLHCVAENKSEVKIPWHKFRKHANSLFLFRLVLYIISFFIVAVPILGIIFFIIMIVTESLPGVASIPGIIIFGLILFTLAIALFLIKKFTFDVVVPIMFLRTTSCVAGWREFMAVLSSNKGRFTLYILFQIVISIAIGAIIFVVFCIGCCLCCVSLLLLIPYINTVILLPLFVFKRSYSLYYLRQFGPGFDVFSIQAEPAENTDL